MQHDESLTEKIAKWINEQGYPLEMSVANAFQRSGFKVVQSDYYEDPESKDQREIDITASIQNDVDDTLVRITYVCECKTSKQKPWILFVSDTVGLYDIARVVQRVASSRGMFLLRKLSHEKAILDNLVFKFAESVGYGITQAFTSGQDTCYSASTSVAKAALARAIEINKYNQNPKRKICELIFPLLIIDAKLFEAKLHPSDGIIVNEINHGTLIWRNPLVKEPHTIINIITTNEIEQYCKKLYDASKEIIEKCNSEYLRNILTIKT